MSKRPRLTSEISSVGLEDKKWKNFVKLAMIHNDERWMRQEQQIVNGRWDSELLKLVLLNTMLNELLCSVLCNGHTYHNQYIALTLGPSLSTLSASSYQILPPILFFFFFLPIASLKPHHNRKNAAITCRDLLFSPPQTGCDVSWFHPTHHLHDNVSLHFHKPFLLQPPWVYEMFRF